MDEEVKVILERLEDLEARYLDLKKQQRHNTKNIDIGLMGGLSFLIFLGLILIGLKIEYHGVAFQIPVETLVKALEYPAIAGAVTAIAGIFLKKLEAKSNTD